MRYTPFGEARSGSIPTDRRHVQRRQAQRRRDTRASAGTRPSASTTTTPATTRRGWGGTPKGAKLSGAGVNQRRHDRPRAGACLTTPSAAASWNPQSLNRYSYVVNNPLRYTDPSGNWWEDPVTGALMPGYSPETLPDAWKGGRRSYPGLGSNAPTILFEGNWPTFYKDAVTSASYKVAVRIQLFQQSVITSKAVTLGENPTALSIPELWDTSPWPFFKQVFGRVTFDHVPGNFCAIDNCWAETHIDWANADCGLRKICYDDTMFDGARRTTIMQNVGHELGHALDQRTGRQARADLAVAMRSEILLSRGSGGFGGRGWEQNASFASGEVFADIHLAWEFNHWASSPESYLAGYTKSKYMYAHMSRYIRLAITGQ